MKDKLILIAGAALTASLAGHAAEPTTITLTDKVLVPHVERMGMHFQGDNYYDSVILKKRVAESFEGGIYRLHVNAPGGADQKAPMSLLAWMDPKKLQEEWIGATAHVLCGPDIWKQVKVLGVEAGKHKDGKAGTVFRFDQPVRWNAEARYSGVMLEMTDLKEGSHPWATVKRELKDGKIVKSYSYEDKFCSPERNEIVIGDTPPGGGGNASLKLDGREGPAFIRFHAQGNNAAPVGGDWTAKVWAKAVGGSPELTFKPSVPGDAKSIAPTGEWKQYTVKLTLPPVSAGDKSALFTLELNAKGGAVLIDNVEAWKDGDSTNPTPFRDGLVTAMRYINPGSVRYLRNTKNSLWNAIVPRIEAASQGGRGEKGVDEFGTHEFYELCEYLKANPWATLPGTMLPEEMDLLMEYHGGPAGTKGGDLRIRLGHEKPWTKVFDKIHIQFGNEAITFFGTGFYGPDYWTALIDRCKKSPYYDPNVFVFHLNEQGCGRAGMDVHPGFDRFTINGYHIFGLYDDQIGDRSNPAELYDFVFASAWHLWMDPQNNKNYEDMVRAKERGKELSIYEGMNYHTTFGSDNPPTDIINHMITSSAGGMSAFHTGLILLKHWGARTQENFNLAQLGFKPGGSFGNIPGTVRVWGGVLKIGNEAERRYRPRVIAEHIANEVIGGDLIETVHTGADPKFSVTKRFGAGYGPSRNPKMVTVKDIPRIHSYAFAEGKRRGLILVSNDPREAQPVNVAFSGGVKGGKAQSWLMVTPGLEGTNEHDWAPEAPQVTVKEEPINFKSGTGLQLPPATIMALEWENE